MAFLASDQKTKEVDFHEKVENVEYNEKLAKSIDSKIQEILTQTFSLFAKQELGKAVLREMSLRERKSILDSIRYRKETFDIEPKKWGYNWRHFENKIMSFK